MAEYWKSAPRHWCKQCKIFIRDTPFEKAQHEATGKHQGNLKRFLRDIHRDNERQQRETQRAKSEVERLRSAISGSPADGATKGAGAPWKRPPAAAPGPVEKQVSIEERKRQMAQLAEMGVAIPQEYRGDMALAGEWQTLSETVVDGATKQSLGVRKRKHEEEMDEEEEEAKKEAEKFVSKPWGSRTRQYPGAQDDTDLDALLASTTDIKKKKPSSSDAPADEDDKTASGAPEKNEEETANLETDQPLDAKEEPQPASVPETKKESEEAAGGVVFKKRKPKVMKK